MEASLLIWNLKHKQSQHPALNTIGNQSSNISPVSTGYCRPVVSFLLPINVDYTLSIVLANEIAFLLSSIIHQMKDLSYKVKYQCIVCWLYKNTFLQKVDNLKSCIYSSVTMANIPLKTRKNHKYWRMINLSHGIFCRSFWKYQRDISELGRGFTEKYIYLYCHFGTISANWCSN